jgi:hypothetical protein
MWVEKLGVTVLTEPYDLFIPHAPNTRGPGKWVSRTRLLVHLDRYCVSAVPKSDGSYIVSLYEVRAHNDWNPCNYSTALHKVDILYKLRQEYRMRGIKRGWRTIEKAVDSWWAKETKAKKAESNGK